MADVRVKALAKVRGVDIGTMYRLGADGKQDPAVLQRLLRSSAEARIAETNGEGIASMDVFPASKEQARALGQHAY